MRRVAALDSLRGLAALAVILFHFGSDVFAWGRYSTTFFFVLSGYLITGIVLDHEGSDGFFRKFYARRALRLLPVYYLTLGLVLLTGWGPVHGLGYYLSFTQNAPLYGMPRVEGCAPDWPLMNHTWSLAVEEQFYLIWPLAVCLVGRRRVPALAALCVVASVLFRVGGISRFTLLGAMDGVALGGWLAARRRLGLPDRGGLSVLAALGAFVAAALWHNPGITRGLSEVAWALVFYAAVAWVSRHPDAPGLAPLRWRPVVGVGTLSYGIYLFHVPVAIVWAAQRYRLATWTGMPWLLDVPLCVAVLVFTPAAAWLSWRMVEKPILQFKRYFEYSERSQALDSPTLIWSAGHRLVRPISWTRLAKRRDAAQR